MQASRDPTLSKVSLSPPIIIANVPAIAIGLPPLIGESSRDVRIPGKRVKLFDNVRSNRAQIDNNRAKFSIFFHIFNKLANNHMDRKDLHNHITFFVDVQRIADRRTTSFAEFPQTIFRHIITKNFMAVFSIRF